MQDKELRDRFDEWTAPLRAIAAPDIAALRGRIRRRTARIGAAAGSALAVVGLVAGLLVAGGLVKGGKPAGPVPPGGQTAAAKYPAPPGQPYVFVNSSATFVNQGDTPATPAELKDAATGKVVTVLQPIGQGTSFANAAVAPDDRAFVLAQQDSNGTVSFAEIRIGASGKPGRLRAVLPGLSMPAGTQQEELTVNAPCTRLSVYAPGPSGTGGSLVVYNLQAGTVIGSWPVAANGYAAEQFLGSGDELVVSVAGVEDGQDRLVDTSTAFRPGSSLLADSRRYPSNGYPGDFTEDGNMWLNTVFSRQSSDGQPLGSELLVEYSAKSGKLLRKIPIGPASALASAYYCGLLWVSANGGEALTQCGGKQLRIVGGQVTSIRLAWLLPSNPSASDNLFAW